MASTKRGVFELRTLDALEIQDEPSFRHVALYQQLKQVLLSARYPFRILPKSASPRADRALLLNLTFWNAQSGGDVLTDARIDADVVAHAAWHHIAARATATTPRAKPSVDALFLGESIASAFDVYLVGRLLGHAGDSTFLATQVPAMAEAAEASGLTERKFERLLRTIADDPDRAFADLRELLFDATRALYACTTAEQAQTKLAGFDPHRFSPLLHHYELSNWVLYARAYAGQRTPDARVRAIDVGLRKRKAPLEWLANQWIAPALG